MSAAIAVDRPPIAPVRADEQVEEVSQPTGDESASTKGAPSFGAVMAASIPLGMVAIFVLATVGMTMYRGDFVGAMGVASYLAIWIGGGFGFIFGGAAWAIRQPHH